MIGGSNYQGIRIKRQKSGSMNFYGNSTRKGKKASDGHAYNFLHTELCSLPRGKEGTAHAGVPP